MQRTYNRTHIAGAGTTTIPSATPLTTQIPKQAGGVLHCITINTPGTLCTVSDSQGTIAVIATTPTATLLYDCAITLPLTVVTTGSPTDLTVCWS